jgi:hypothetical protein
MSPSVGFWFMHEPFEPGERHTVVLGDIQPDGSRFPEFTVQLVAVPEPGSMCLANIAAMAMLCVLRHKKRTAH